MDLQYIESLAQLVHGTSVREVTVRRGEQAVTLRCRPGGATVVLESGAVAADESGSTDITTWTPRSEMLLPVAVGEGALVSSGADPGEATTEIVKAHRVGFFRRAKGEGGDPMVSVGDWVASGQQLASIESMRLYDEVDAPVSGKLLGIFVDDGTAVEYGQPLFHIELCDAPEAEPQPEPEEAQVP